jgi:glycolate oxidase iron-sulfur subunit
MWSGRSRPLLARLLTMAASMTWAHRIAGRIRRAAHGTGPLRARRAARTTNPVQISPAEAEPASLMLGCFERSLYPGVSRAARSLAPELRVPAAQGCCGALHAHNGDPERGTALGRRLGEVMPGTIVTTSGGCAAHLADTIGRDRVLELSTYLAGRATGRVLVDGRPARVTLQDSCHLRNGLGVWQEPRAAVAAVADLVELPDAARCCGAAGTYSMLRRADSRTILDPKLDQIEAAGVDYVVAVNPGCLRQLQQGLRRRRSPVRAIHLAQLLTLAATGEPEPTPGSTP